MTSHPMLPLLYKMLGHFAIFGTAVGGILAVDVDFRNQITLGSLFIAAVILVISGVFTARSKIATVWREEAEGEKAAKERLQQELNQALANHSAFEKNQQEIRHELKNKIAELSSQIKVMEAKTDLTAALKAIKEIAVAQEEGHHETHNILKEIRDKLPSEPIEIKEPVIVRDARVE